MIENNNAYRLVLIVVSRDRTWAWQWQTAYVNTTKYTDKYQVVKLNLF